MICKIAIFLRIFFKRKKFVKFEFSIYAAPWAALEWGSNTLVMCVLVSLMRSMFTCTFTLTLFDERRA